MTLLSNYNGIIIRLHLYYYNILILLTYCHHITAFLSSYCCYTALILQLYYNNDPIVPVTIYQIPLAFLNLSVPLSVLIKRHKLIQ